MPCDVQTDSINSADTEEVVIPPCTKLRTINVKRFASGSKHTAKIFLETVQYPSVWDSIKNLDSQQFQKFAELNPEVVAENECNDSIVNTLAKAAASHAQKVGAHWRWRTLTELILGRYGHEIHSCAKSSISASAEEAGTRDEVPASDRPLREVPAMFETCATVGANMNEEDPETGFSPLYFMAECTSNTETPALQNVLSGCVESMVICGANPHAPLKGLGGRTVANKFEAAVPELKRIFDNASELMRPCRWEYWVDDGVNGKPDGWYPFDQSAGALVSVRYARYAGAKEDAPEVTAKSGEFGFYYTVDFCRMTQCNTRTKTVRKIRRRLL